MKNVSSSAARAGILLVSLLALAFASAQETDEPISWVNPELPNGLGLTHYTHFSKAMRHEVGYVVWTPPEYGHQPNARFPAVYFLHGMGGNESMDARGLLR